MQTFSQIRELLDCAGLRPQKQFGQNFLIDGNLMGKLLALAGLDEDATDLADRTVLEVGPGTGSLTEELLARAGRVVAVEIDRGLAAMLREHFAGRENLTLLQTDILAGKTQICPAVHAALGPAASLVANLPYGVATPLIVQCLVDSWHASRAGRSDLTMFESLTFTVQLEVADRFAAPSGGKDYGAVSAVVQLLGDVTPGAVLPGSAFWPRPNVSSRMVRIDFSTDKASEINNIDTLLDLLSAAFAQRRKQLGSLLKRKGLSFAPDALSAAMSAAGIDPTSRAEQVTPEQFRVMANALG